MAPRRFTAETAAEMEELLRATFGTPLVIEGANGRWQVQRIMDEHGATVAVSGWLTAAEMTEFIQGMLAGFHEMVRTDRERGREKEASSEHIRTGSV